MALQLVLAIASIVIDSGGFGKFGKTLVSYSTY